MYAYCGMSECCIGIKFKAQLEQVDKWKFSSAEVSKDSQSKDYKYSWLIQYKKLTTGITQAYNKKRVVLFISTAKTAVYIVLSLYLCCSHAANIAKIL